ncbi:choice-of-anchor P family protein [Actinomadura sp. HBU206391]|uniref:choice-of-anchor P family protein n=1 Tax=Actinomadura sp. HBU206391 TaxID=2731692 RepID=UPI0016501DFE|nr:choice-of-anchor P family protein [Actinomadura sp. HBU206391]MBC6457260.1 hypothetical protein [Actinomadura sp. HBU206391]
MRLTQLTKAAAVAGALVAPLAVAAPATHASTGAASSAYGIAASGLVSLPPVSAVASFGRPARDSVAELPANPLLRASVLSAAAAPGHARASVADLRSRKLGLSAHLITARCENGVGSSNLVKVVLGGRPLDATASPNTALNVGLDSLGAASVVLNKQGRDVHGRLTVTAVEVTVALAPGRTQTISIASATCGPVSGPAEAAPVPTPVPGDLPVTG